MVAKFSGNSTVINSCHQQSYDLNHHKLMLGSNILKFCFSFRRYAYVCKYVYVYVYIYIWYTCLAYSLVLVPNNSKSANDVNLNCKAAMKVWGPQNFQFSQKNTNEARKKIGLTFIEILVVLQGSYHGL